MSRIRANNFTDKAGTGAPTFPHGAVVTGVVTATSFSGTLSGDVTGNVTGNSTGLSGTPNITVGIVNGNLVGDVTGDITGNLIGNVTGDVTGNLTGDVTGTATTATNLSDAANITTGTIASARLSGTYNITSTNAQGLTGSPSITVTDITASGNISIGGTLTYEDVTNIDSVGLVTARNGIKVTSGGASFVGPLTERAVISADAISTDNNCSIDSGLVHYRTANLGGSSNTVSITSSVGVNTVMSTGDTMSLTVIHAVNSSSSYINNLTVDGLAVTETWIGGSEPSDGGTSGVDIYAFTIIKTASDTYTVIGNQTKTS